MEDKLVIIEEDNTFFDMNEDKTNLKEFENKHVVLEIRNDGCISVVAARVLSVNDQDIVIEKYNDGSNETLEMWKDDKGEPDFVIEVVPIDNIRGIEEYIKCSDLVFKDEYIGKVCKLINKNDNEIIVRITSFDDVIIFFENKYRFDNEIRISENMYFLHFLKDIIVLDN